MTDMQRACGVRAHKLNLNLLTFSDIRSPIKIFLIMDMTEHPVPGIDIDKKIDKPRPGDFGPLNHVFMVVDMVENLLGNLSGRPLLGRRHNHGDIGREITMPFIFWDFDLHFRQFLGRKNPFRNSPIYGFGDKCVNLLFHIL